MYYAYVARDKGFFAEEGIEVELLPGKGGSYVVHKLGRTIDLGIIAVNSVLPAWDKGIDIKMVYQVNVTNLFDFMVAEDSSCERYQTAERRSHWGNGFRKRRGSDGSLDPFQCWFKS